MGVRTERSEGPAGTGRPTGREAGTRRAVAVRGVPEPAICGYNGEDPNSRRSQGLYSDRRVER